ncbi:MAG: molybdopterin-dependent oxidoreductase [Bacillota bacterium]
MGQAYRNREEFLRLARVHRYNAIAVGILLLTGLLLFATPLRGVLAPVRVPMKNLHIWGGLALGAYAVATAGWWLAFLVRPRLHVGRRLNTVLAAVWLGGWTITGILMWLRGSVPYTWANTATTLHDWLTWTALPWLLLHVAFRLAKVQRPGERIEVTAWLAHPATRRTVLQAGLAALGLAWLWRRLSTSPAERLVAEEEEDLGPPVDPKTLAGGGMVGRFRLYFINQRIPRFDPETWRLVVGPRTYTWEQFLALPQRELVCNFHCVTGWSVMNITWVGIRLADLLADARVGESPAILFHSGDGEYTDSLTWSQAMDPDVLLAFQMEGRRLPRLNGGPIRLLVPQMYGYKSVKWVERITPHHDPDYHGYWQLRGYKVNAYLEKGEPPKGGNAQEWGNKNPAWYEDAVP